MADQTQDGSPSYDLTPVDHQPDFVEPANGWSSLPAPHGVPQLTLGHAFPSSDQPAPYDLVPVDQQPQFADAPVPKAGKTIQPVAVGQDLAAMPGKVASAVGDVIGVSDAASALRGEMTPEEAQMFALGAVPALVAPEARAVKATAGLAMDEASRMARAADQGFEGPWYHGSWRTDRLTEKGAIISKRATSGPMPYFTDDPEMASGYAMGKKMDTSLDDYGDVKQYFTVDPKEVFPGSRMRSPITVEQSWNYLPRDVQQDILSKAKRVGYANPDTGNGPIILHPPGIEATLSPNHFDYIMKTEARGNPLAALRDMWHDGGNLVGDETELATIYKLAGYPYKISETNAPWTEARGVMPVMLRMSNPLHTDDQARMTNEILPALEQQFKRDRTRTDKFGADMWDKNRRYTPKEWIEQAKQDYAKGDNSFVWTSIPDKISGALESMGFDGILDTGGKMGGQTHRVAIPFKPEQVRSRFAAFHPANVRKAATLGAVSGVAAAGAQNLQDAPSEILPKRAGGGNVGHIQSTIAPLAQTLDQAVPDMDTSGFRPSTNVEDVRDKPGWQKAIETITRKPMFDGSDDPYGATQRAHGGRVEAKNINHAPTEAQKDAGNYAKDHVHIQGLPITIENARGKKRRGVGRDGKPWEVQMPAHYGYIKQTEGSDGDHVDVYVGPHIRSPHVYVVDQVDADNKKFDEHKVMLGFGSEAQAVNTYKRGFSDGKGANRIGTITGMSVTQFRDWLRHGNHGKPFRHVVGRSDRVREILHRHGITP